MRHVLEADAALRVVGEAGKEIAEALCISARTVDHHRTSLSTKLDLHGPHALTKFAVKHQSALRRVEPSGT